MSEHADEGSLGRAPDPDESWMLSYGVYTPGEVPTHPVHLDKKDMKRAVAAALASSPLVEEVVMRPQGKVWRSGGQGGA